MTEERAYVLALHVAGTGSYRVLDVRRAWSTTVAWQGVAEDRRTDEHLLLLSENQFDARLMEAGQPDAGEIIIAQVTAHTNERAATLLTS